MSIYTDKFDEICGDCSGLRMSEITQDDVREQAAINISQGADITENDIADALRGLAEYQDADFQDALRWVRGKIY